MNNLRHAPPTDRRLSLLSFALLLLFLPAILAAAEKVENGAPIALYLTIEKNPSTSIAVRWVTNADDHSDKILYKQGGYPRWIETTGTHRQMPNGHPYIIHYVELSSLTPDSDYFFHLDNDETVYKFRTLPENLQQPIRFVVGGDLLHDTPSTFAETNRLAAATDPMFALLGGDIAYAAPKSSLFSDDVNRWLQWLKTWNETMVSNDGRVIPFLIAIGNHDVVGRFHQTPEKAFFFYSLFRWPALEGYHVVDFDDYMSIWVLDSAHTHPVEGKQKEWLEYTLKKRKARAHKFALYHVPAYPSFRSFDGKISTAIRKSWTPLFDEYGINCAFENHDHAYKRTLPLYNGAVDKNRGLLYIGDGAWGVKKPRSPKERWYLAKSASKRHFILVTLYGKQRHYNAIDERGNLIDYTTN